MCEDDSLRLKGRVYTFAEFEKKYLTESVKHVTIKSYYKPGDDFNFSKNLDELMKKVHIYHDKTYPVETKDITPFVSPETPELYDEVLETDNHIKSATWTEYKNGKSWSDICDEVESKN